MAKKTTKAKAKNSNKKDKRTKIILIILLILFTIGIAVLIFFLLKQCAKPGPSSDEYTVTVHQPEPEKAQGYVVYANGNTGTFRCAPGTVIQVIVSDHGINIPSPEEYYTSPVVETPKNEYQATYQVVVCYGPEQYLYFLLEWDDVYSYYVASFTMLAADIDINIQTKLDPEQFCYVKRNGRIWIIDDESLKNGDMPITLVEFTESFPQGETKQIERIGFNEPVYVGNEITNLTDYFLNRCPNFDSTITFNKKTSQGGQEYSVLKIIGNSFMSGCEYFNKPIDIPDSTLLIDGDFLHQCTHYNKPINTNNVQYLGYNETNHFMYKCTGFNSEIKIPNVKVIPSFFMNACKNFNQPITIPSTVTEIRDSFMFNCDAMTSAITFNCPTSAILARGDWNTCGTTNKDAACCTTGIKIRSDLPGAEGTAVVNKWMECNPNGQSTTAEVIYRKLKAA